MSSIIPKEDAPSMFKNVFRELQEKLFEYVYSISLRIDQHCMHTCFASLLRNRNGEFHLTLMCLTYAVDAGNLYSLYSST